MRILLTTLNSKYIHSNLALKYLYGVTAGSGLDISLQEFTINQDYNYIYGEIVRGGYDVICFSTYIWNVEEIRRLGEDLNKALPGAKFILGGPEVSYCAEEFLHENPWADAVLRGEGEIPFFGVCKAIILNGEVCDFDSDIFDRVASLTRRTTKGIVSTADTSLVSMDSLPFPYEHLPLEEDRVIYYESSRGCPYRCSYCLSSIDKSVRFLSMEKTKWQLAYFLAADVKQVKFIDRTFNASAERAYEIWDYLIKNDNGITNFHFEICAELMTDEQIALLHSARKGQFQFEIGVQSTNPVTLRAVGRRADSYLAIENIGKLIANGNAHVHVDLIAGLPYESYGSFARSFNKLYAAKADMVQLGFLKLLRGTRSFEERKEHEYEYRERAPYEVISNKYISAKELVKLHQIETVLDLYYNRGGFGRSINYLDCAAASSSFDFYEKLADFYYANGYQKRSHRKEDLYRILYKFATECGGAVDKEKAFAYIESDLVNHMNEDAVKKFRKKGWEIKSE